jgi:hypothetical protein
MKPSTARKTKSSARTALAQGQRKRSAVPDAGHPTPYYGSLFDKAADLAGSLGPFLAFVLAITGGGIAAIEIAHTDAAAVSIASVLIAGMCVGFLARLWRVP